MLQLRTLMYAQSAFFTKKIQLLALLLNFLYSNTIAYVPASILVQERRVLMPELPEVETVVRGLSEQIVDKKIEDVKIFYPKMVHMDGTDFTNILVGQKVLRIERFGKYILVVLENLQVVRIHLRMEGKFFMTQVPEDITLDKYVHVRIQFTDGSYLKYHDVRKFGTFELVEYQENWHQDQKFTELGFEPWEPGCTTAFIYERLQKSTRMIKPFLLDQKTIVGLGNIYVDEVLFRAQIHPETRTNMLSFADAEKIRLESIAVLEKAIALGGTTVNTYHNTFGIDGRFQNELHAYGKKDEPCSRCGTPMVKIKVGGRGTYYCPNCQKRCCTPVAKQ